MEPEEYALRFNVVISLSSEFCKPKEHNRSLRRCLVLQGWSEKRESFHRELNVAYSRWLWQVLFEYYCARSAAADHFLVWVGWGKGGGGSKAVGVKWESRGARFLGMSKGIYPGRELEGKASEMAPPRLRGPCCLIHHFVSYNKH